eukprot:CAMPEP_0197470920 /NCGR_PEP_ID=MMETSP1309-20131121/1729_1 /TAXON_ID=464262 /ORGANISM="Genus nov. species nov., Strain RCC998" /LENGTH=147 /DNA_ID=CAMNT_0043008191 /DNA_START=47 /DNA_END=490 /DNA_ORIENTATION=+
MAEIDLKKEVVGGDAGGVVPAGAGQGGDHAGQTIPPITGNPQTTTQETLAVTHAAAGAAAGPGQGQGQGQGVAATAATTNGAEAAATSVSEQINIQALPIRQYLEGTVVTLLVNGLTQLVKTRPDDPVEYLAAYLLKNNPKKKQTTS